jgi:hypothetical protein
MLRRQQVSELGSDFLLASLGLNVIGVHSLTTGSRVAELSLPFDNNAVAACRVLTLTHFTLTDQFGASSTRAPPCGPPTAALPAGVVQPLFWTSFLAVAFAQPRSFVKLFRVRSRPDHGVALSAPMSFRSQIVEDSPFVCPLFVRV